MRLDIYKRPENDGQYSYLAVPEGQVIPAEATAVDWQAEERSVDFNEEVNQLPQFAIDDPIEQISAKGYAITSVRNLNSVGSGL